MWPSCPISRPKYRDRYHKTLLTLTEFVTTLNENLIHCLILSSQTANTDRTQVDSQDDSAIYWVKCWWHGALQQMEMKALSAQSCCVHEKNMQHMHGNIPHMFDCWADPFSFPSTKELCGVTFFSTRCLCLYTKWQTIGEITDVQKIINDTTPIFGNTFLRVQVGKKLQAFYAIVHQVLDIIQFFFAVVSQVRQSEFYNIILR